MAGHGKAVDTAIAQQRGKHTFLVDVSKWVQKAKISPTLVIQKVLMDLGTEIILKTPVDTGRARNSWMFGLGSINTSVASEDNTDKAGATALSALKTALSSFSAESHPVVFFTNSLPYILRLEYGWSQRQAPNGMVRITIANFNNTVVEAVKAVRNNQVG